jgi:hypothetical protein
MDCHTCGNSYIGQTGRTLNTRYKEHIRYIKNNNGQSAYATHILNNLHSFGPIDTTMTLIHKTYKGKRMNTLENYYIQYFHYHNRLIQEQTITKPNPLFQLVYNQESKNLDSDRSTDTHTNT